MRTATMILYHRSREHAKEMPANSWSNFSPSLHISHSNSSHRHVIALVRPTAPIVDSDLSIHRHYSVESSSDVLGTIRGPGCSWPKTMRPLPACGTHCTVRTTRFMARRVCSKMSCIRSANRRHNFDLQFTPVLSPRSYGLGTCLVRSYPKYTWSTLNIVLLEGCRRYYQQGTTRDYPTWTVISCAIAKSDW